MYFDWFCGRGQLSEEAVSLEVCKYMGWDFHTYQNQPVRFIHLILARMQGEASAQDYLSRKQQQP